jgi:glycerol kinase
MVGNDWMLQFLADILALRVERPRDTETTALGAALLAAVGAGWFESLGAATAVWHLDRGCDPAMTADRRADLLAGWDNAVAAARAASG